MAELDPCPDHCAPYHICYHPLFENAIQSCKFRRRDGEGRREGKDRWDLSPIARESWNFRDEITNYRKGRLPPNLRLSSHNLVHKV
eukprot:scaffold2946_cov278-Chaetoceros_neogracile.AAC.5